MLKFKYDKLSKLRQKKYIILNKCYDMHNKNKCDKICIN